jgi:phospholipase C
MRHRVLTAIGAPTVLAVAAAMGITLQAQGASVRAPSTQQIRQAAIERASQVGIHKIKHIIVIMQENRSFDEYFGTYPGADGIPSNVCVPDPLHGGCQAPYVNHNNANMGGPHTDQAFTADVDGGKMDGFVKEAETQCKPGKPCNPDVMGYHVCTDIPNYCQYAKNFVLDDHMYESPHSWSLPSHLAMVSAWSATCRSHSPMSCKSSDSPVTWGPANPKPYAWTDLTYLLNKFGVSWGYYLDHGAKTPANPNGVPPIWNVLPGFTDLTQSTTGGVQPLSNFMTQAQAGTLPQLSWIVPDSKDSEHPAALVSTGQAYVTKIINAVMQSSDWNSSAIFLSWDDWGGFYDHKNPLPYAPDSWGWGIRVPGLVISPYALQNVIDGQPLSADAYLKFIEDDFMGGQRLDPATDGRPDSRLNVRENYSQLGDLTADFNFNQSPRPPMILNPCPPTTLRNPLPNATCTNSVPLQFRSWGDR